MQPDADSDITVSSDEDGDDQTVTHTETSREKDESKVYELYNFKDSLFFYGNLVPRVFWLFGQRVGARRDSGEFEKILIF